MSEVSMVSLPPSGIASRAFTARLMITCSICPGSTNTLPRPGASTATSSMSELILEQVVARARAHRLHRAVLAHGPGDDDEGQVEAHLLDHFQRRAATERRQGPVGDHDVPGALREGSTHRRGVLDARRLDGPA